MKRDMLLAHLFCFIVAVILAYTVGLWWAAVAIAAVITIAAIIVYTDCERNEEHRS